jgi:RNA polymerase sigma factor (sigma-70 family)
LIHETQPDVESDAALLARFARLRDEAAFAELMRRHGPMVLGVSSRMLRQPQDAEDALQAVFLTLSARARSLRRVRSVAGWLHNVAVRISLNLLKMKRRREEGLRRLHKVGGEPDVDEPNELKDLLDAELAQLPARFKEIVILRDLEGYSRSEVARKLGVPPGTVDSRLSRGRKLLRDRLVRRGITVGAGGLTAALASSAHAVQPLSITLIQEAFRNTELFSIGTSISGVAAVAKITSLAQKELNTMFLTKLSRTTGIVALVAALVLGAVPGSQIIGLSSFLQAAQFFDDFNDGSATDGTPVTWAPWPFYSNGTYTIEQNSFVLRPNVASQPLVSLVDGVMATDVSIRAQVRASGESAGTALFARFSGENQHTYQGGIETSGNVYIGWNGADTQFHNLGTVSTDLRPNQEDVVLQFDVFGNSLELFAWRPGEAKPTVPTVMVIDNQFAGLGQIGLLHHPIGTGSGTFRYVSVANVPIPEPATVALGSLGFVALASFAFRIRLSTT